MPVVSRPRRGVFAIERRQSVGCCSAASSRKHGPWRGKRLVIVAAGALEYLPFAALPLPQANDRAAASKAAVPFMARHEIVEAPLASVLATLRRDAAPRMPP